MIRAKWDSIFSPIPIVHFDDVDEPVYPMPGDIYELYDDNENVTVQAVVTMVSWSRKLIYFNLNIQNR